jgi:ATP-dependent helicase/nuclease subunit A
MKSTAPAQTLADQNAREESIRERARDVVLLAGAGTGKTTLLVSRFIEFVAPESDAIPPVPIERIAAVTFTRKAAGELKNRIRIELLALLEAGAPKRPSQTRMERIQAAISGLDHALIGTIHSFADRLLRLRPIEARISPEYRLIEDESELIQETLERWSEGAKLADLGSQWSDPKHAPAAATLKAAEKWFMDLIHAGVRPLDTLRDFNTVHGVEGLIWRWVTTRDRPVPAGAAPGPDSKSIDDSLKSLEKKLDDTLRAVPAHQMDKGAKALMGDLKEIRKALEASGTAERLRILKYTFKDLHLRMKTDFTLSGSATWNLYKEIHQGNPSQWADRILTSMERELFSKAAAVIPVILSLYEDVKRRHEVIDLMDLLIRLRALLKGNAQVCLEMSDLFDHIFVDEFQDTDPIQSEILFLLSRKKGTLTIIGDPKQSIYRFRRADIGEFASAIGRLRKRGALEHELKVNFRSRPDLIEVFNKQFPAFFGSHPTEESREPFDISSGWVAFSPLEASPDVPPAPSPSLHFLRLKNDNYKVGVGRPLEARLAARHIAWLISPRCAYTIRDEESKKDRAIRGGDIAILARAMSDIRLLVQELRSYGVECHVSGGKDYAKNPLLQRFILVLNQVANPDDGVGALALHQGIYSSLTAADALGPPGEALKKWLSELRRRRTTRPVLHTALDVIEQSLALRILGLGINADEDLGVLYRFAGILDETARARNFDFDRAARWAREWLEFPPKTDGPAAENSHAVRIMTIHQSKGLEFPVVYLFDGFSEAGKDRGDAYRVSEDGNQWSISAGGFSAEFNPKCVSPSLKTRESNQTDHEQIRLHYVAATRAKDILIIPIADAPSSRALYPKVWAPLLNGSHALTHPAVDAEQPGTHLIPHAPREEWKPPKTVEDAIQWNPSAGQIAENHFPQVRTVSVTRLAHSGDSESQTPPPPVIRRLEPDGEEAPLESGGTSLGNAVHRAVSLALAGDLPVEEALRIATLEAPMSLDASLALKHAEGALHHFKEQGYLDGQWSILSEFPFLLTETLNGVPTLIRGVIDVIFVRGSEAVIIDLKTDREKDGKAADPAHVRQLGIYARAVKNLAPKIEKIETRLFMTSTGASVTVEIPL